MRFASRTLPLVISVLGVTSTVFGIEWDIAWHRSIGRDAFWTPPHVAVYLGGVLAGVSAALAILTTTFARSGERDASVRIWGFRGPLGAFVSAWGGLAMIASAPFDDWWHNTYGVDVKILSPPHTVLALGMFGVCIGGLLLVGAARNRSPDNRLLHVVYFYVGGLALAIALTFVLAYTSHVLMHSATAYRVFACAVPLPLLAFGRGSGARFGATWIAVAYTAFFLLLLWFLPLVPAVPKLGPVYYQTTHLVPPGFPLLIVVPALAIDLACERLAERALGWRALVAGTLFVGLMIAVQWTFSDFLVSESAENWVFGSAYHSYNSHPSWAEFHHAFYDLDGSSSRFVVELAIAFAAAIATSWIGLAWSESLRKLRR